MGLAGRDEALVHLVCEEGESGVVAGCERVGVGEAVGKVCLACKCSSTCRSAPVYACACMYVCLHACMYVCTHACMYACMHEITCGCMHVI